MKFSFDEILENDKQSVSRIKDKSTRGEFEVNSDYHKGSFCVITDRFCQEGYCSECAIFERKSLLPTVHNRYNTDIKITNQEKSESNTGTQHFFL